MIDEEKLIEDFMNNYLVKNDGTWNDAIDRAIELAKTAPKIGIWIPCSERLPDTRNNVLICQNDGYVSIGYYSQEKFLDLNSYPFSEVIAWQPLPEEYHGDIRNE